jgi:hypothetical protein
MGPAEEHVLKTMRKIVGSKGHPGEWHNIDLDDVRHRLTDMREETLQSSLRVIAQWDRYRPIDESHGRVKM